jgi:hypothetical protein
MLNTSTNIEVMAVCDTSNKPKKLFCNMANFIFAYKVYTNVLAYANNETYYINAREAKIIRRIAKKSNRKGLSV